MRILAFAALPLAAAGPAPTTFTYAQLKGFGTPEVALLLLGASGERMVEHRIFIAEGGFSDPIKGRLRSVRFAGTPEYRTDGTCGAQGAQLSFIAVGKSLQPDAAVRVHSSEVGKLWAILPEGATDCAALGPVLGNDRTPGSYFRTQGPEATELGARSVHTAVALLRVFLTDSTRKAPVRCSIDFDGPDSRQAACDAGRFADMFDLRRISVLRVGDCRHAQPPAGDAETCASFVFPDPSDTPGSGVYLRLALVTDLAAGTMLTDAARIVRVRIDKVSWVA